MTFRELIRSTPQLQYQAERQAAKLHRVAKAHSLHLIDPTELFHHDENIPDMISEENDGTDDKVYYKSNQSQKFNTIKISRKDNTKKKKITKIDGQQWDDFIKRKESEFSSHHSKILSKCTENSLWQPIESESLSSDYENIHKYSGMQSNENRNEENNNNIDIDRDNIENDNNSSDSLEGSDSSDDDDDDDGFRAQVKGSRTTRGWGLYTVNVESDSEEVERETKEIEIDDNEEEKEEEKEEEEEEANITEKKTHDSILFNTLGVVKNGKKINNIQGPQAIPENNNHCRKKTKTIVADFVDSNYQQIKKIDESYHGDDNSNNAIGNMNVTVHISNSYDDNSNTKEYHDSNSDNFLPLLRKRKKRTGCSVGDSMLSLSR